MAQQTMIIVVRAVGVLQQVTAKFSKVDITGMEIRSDGKENILKFQGINQTAQQMLGVGIGDTVQVTFEIQGREWIKGENVIIFMNLHVIHFTVLQSAGSRNNLGGVMVPAQVVSGLGSYGSVDDECPF